jgi:hypothetical protein
MKKLLSILWLALLAGGLFSCTDDEDLWGTANNEHRIAQKSMYYDGVEECREYYTYSKDRLVLKTHDHETTPGSGVWAPVYREMITYTSTGAVSSYSELEDGVWVEYGRHEYVMDKGRVMEEMISYLEDGVWEPDVHYVYEYSGNNLLSRLTYRFNEDGEEEQYRLDVLNYLYGRLDNLRLYRLEEGGDLQLREGLNFSYNPLGLLAGYTVAWYEDGAWANEGKATYEYLGNKIRLANYYDWVPELMAWEAVPEQQTMTYTVHGDLASRADEEYAEEYIYEEGNGNARFFETFMEELVVGMPTIKSAAAGNGESMGASYLDVYLSSLFR